MKKPLLLLSALVVPATWVLLSTVAILSSCTEQSRTRNFGGTEEVVLEDNEKFINITWKEDALWILTEDTLTGDYHFRESSSYGIWEGEVIIKSE